MVEEQVLLWRGQWPTEERHISPGKSNQRFKHKSVPIIKNVTNYAWKSKKNSVMKNSLRSTAMEEDKVTGGIKTQVRIMSLAC